MDNLNLPEKCVLVIDDFANVRKSIKTQLQDLGVRQVVEAYDSTSASKALKDYQFDLILCDFNLGKGKDGSRLLEEWRLTNAIRQETIFVLITAETSRDMVVSAMEYQPDDYLAKPFSMDVFSNRIVRWFEKRNVFLPLLNSVEEGDWPIVTQQARLIMEQYPRHRAAAQRYYAQSLVKQGILTEAENFLRGLVDKRYLSWAQAEIHRIDMLQENYQVAEKGLKNVLIRDPNLTEAYDLLAEVLKKLNKTEDLQKWLEVAVNRAPKNIKRQETLAEVAQGNEDYYRSSVAYRDIMNMSSDTIHENVGVYQKYLNSLHQEEITTDSEQRKRDIHREMASASRRMTDRYQSDPSARLYAKAMALMEQENLRSTLHEKQLNKLLISALESIDRVNGETAIICTQVMYRAERLSEGDELVERFRSRFAEQPDILERLQALQAEPASQEKRQKATDLNLKGVECYKNKEFTESIVYFQEAMQLSPRHPGIILNFVQSHLVEMRTDKVNIQKVELCLEYLNRLVYLPEDHYQYERYRKLTKTLKKMKQGK
ncbi:MAG: response regulator [Reinekea sp.]|jgi:CheY-like chemotaxis protein